MNSIVFIIKDTISSIVPSSNDSGAYIIRRVITDVKNLPTDNSDVFLKKFWSIISENPYFLIQHSHDIYDVLPQFEKHNSCSAFINIWLVTANDDYAWMLRENFTKELIKYIPKDVLAYILINYDYAACALGWEIISNNLSLSKLVELKNDYEGTNLTGYKGFKKIILENTNIFERMFCSKPKEKLKKTPNNNVPQKKRR